MACVELPAFPLQLLLQRHPDWSGRPVAVVDRDKPQGVILWVDEHARACRIRTGMRYGAGLSLARTLHAGEVPPAEIERGVAALADRLRRFSPDVEPSRDEPGIFWLNASGLSHLYASPRRWADAVVGAVQAGGFRASVAVGFTRFGTYAIARNIRTGEAAANAGATGAVPTGPPAVVVRDPAAERVLAGEAPLDRLGLDPALRDSLQKLGIETLRAFLRLPPAGIRRRFGPDAERLHRLAAGDLWVPLQPLRVRDPLVARHDFDDPETDVSRLLFAIERLLNRVLAMIAARSEMLGALTLHLRLDRATAKSEQIRPAAPTLDAVQLLGLVRLRLEALALDSGVVELRVTARAVRTAAAQQGLFVERPPRDPAAANRALARVRAEFGDDAVVRARLAEAHLPEAQFAWESLEAAPRPAPAPRPAAASRSATSLRDRVICRPDGAPRPAAASWSASAPRSAAGDVARRPLVRRIHARPIPLPPRPRHEPDGWLLRGGETGQVEDLAGPYLVTGGWWRSAVQREYYFARMRDGDLLWIYYDRPRRRWCWQGRVE